jgi:hypothetical protein
MKRSAWLGGLALVLAAAGTGEGGPLGQDRKAPELEGGKAWFNTEKPVRLADLRGKIVLLDFWTYC